MKKIYFIILFVITLYSCESTQTKRAKEYIAYQIEKKQFDDTITIKSYETSYQKAVFPEYDLIKYHRKYDENELKYDFYYWIRMDVCLSFDELLDNITP